MTLSLPKYLWFTLGIVNNNFKFSRQFVSFLLLWSGIGYLPIRLWVLSNIIHNRHAIAIVCFSAAQDFYTYAAHITYVQIVDKCLFREYLNPVFFFYSTATNGVRTTWREPTHVTDLGTKYCLNRDIRTRHNDNDDAPVFFFFFHNNIRILWTTVV